MKIKTTISKSNKPKKAEGTRLRLWLRHGKQRQKAEREGSKQMNIEGPTLVSGIAQGLQNFGRDKLQVARIRLQVSQY